MHVLAERRLCGSFRSFADTDNSFAADSPEEENMAFAPAKSGSLVTFYDASAEKYFEGENDLLQLTAKS